MKIEGVGDCTVCKYDKENKKCIMYCPVSIRIIDIIEDEIGVEWKNNCT
jgi:hypothetical protein